MMQYALPGTETGPMAFRSNLERQVASLQYHMDGPTGGGGSG